jgi:hypothetical protein
MCAAGHPWVGSPGPALVTGATAATFWRAQAEARREIETAVIRDAGYTADDAPKGLELAAASIAQSAILQASAFARLVESGGPFTTAGRTRQAYSVWQAATDRLERGLRLVGLQRRSVSVDPRERLLQVMREGS